MITVTGACDLFNNEIVWGLLLIVGGFIIYFTHNVFIDRKDKICYLFQEVRETEILEAIYLVCAILRYGYSLLLFQLKAYFDIS